MTERRLPPRPPQRAQLAARALRAYQHELRVDTAVPPPGLGVLTLCAAAVIGADDEHCGGLGFVVAGEAIYREDVARLVSHAAGLTRTHCAHVDGGDPGCSVCLAVSARDRIVTALRVFR